MAEWSSPDDKIFKKILEKGHGHLKPYDDSVVRLRIHNCPESLDSFNNKDLVVGDSDGELGRIIDVCVSTMLLNEKAQFTIAIGLEDITAVIELAEFSFSGFIYEWNAQKKMDLAFRHKEKGASHFNNRNHVEAAYRFIKALKILTSIPIAVESKEDLVDEIPRTDLQALTGKLYNNLSSCYFRENIYNLVVPLCQKALEFEPNNVKALYKLGVAYKIDRDFERAENTLSKVIEMEPQNKACEIHLVEVRDELKKANAKIDDIMRKMFVGSISK